MSETVWYHAAYNEIWIRHGLHRIERGCQGEIDVFNNGALTVPDRLSLFLWKVDRTIWKRHELQGWLIRMENL